MSCSLICAVSVMCTSFQETLVQNEINETGYYHLKISGVTEKDIKELKDNKEVKNIFTINELGYSKLKDSKNENKPYLKLFSMDKDVFEKLKFNLIEGRFPLNSNEVIISKHIIDNAKVNYKVGEKIYIQVGQRVTLENDELFPKNPYQKNDEKLINTKQYEFTIVRYYGKSKL